MIPQNRYNSIGILPQIQKEINPLNRGFWHPHFWLAIMNSLSLKGLILQKKEYIIREMNRRLGQTPWSPYQEFILRTREGQRRIETWVGLLILSLEGDRETFFKDEERVGYYRAVQGFPLSFSHQIHLSFRQVIGDVLKEEAAQKRIRLLDLWGEIQELNEILFTGYHIVAASFLKTREELINEKVTYLQEISEFTREMITLLNLPEIIHFILRKMTQFFGTEKCLILLLRDRRIQGIYTFPPLQENEGIRSIMEKALEEGISLFIDEGGRFSERSMNPNSNAWWPYRSRLMAAVMDLSLFITRKRGLNSRIRNWACFINFFTSRPWPLKTRSCWKRSKGTARNFVY